jgi:hypothetical protein
LPWAAFIDVISASTCRHHHTPGWCTAEERRTRRHLKRKLR